MKNTLRGMLPLSARPARRGRWRAAASLVGHLLRKVASAVPGTARYTPTLLRPGAPPNEAFVDALRGKVQN